MFETLQEVWFYILIPPLAILVGAAVGMAHTPRPFVESSIQRFAAGMIFAAVAAELLPQLLETGRAWVIGGFAAGTILMFASKLITERVMGVRVGHSKGDAAPGAASLIVASAVNFVVDGFLLGVGFAVGTEEGILLMIAVAVENLFLGLSSMVALKEMGMETPRQVAVALFLGVLFGVPAVLGVTVLGGLSGRSLAIVVAFGAAALLYLVTEELLVEAHEAMPENPVTASMFFAGFLILLMLEMQVHGH